MRILLVTDRSAGHLFPALSLAAQIEAQGDQVMVFTTAGYLAECFLPNIRCISGRDTRGKPFFYEFLVRAGEAVRVLVRFKPRKIIGFGGRGSFWFIILGVIMGLDTAIYEPNVVLGKANRLLVRVVRRLWYGIIPPCASPKARFAGIPPHPHITRYEKRPARQKLNLPEDKPVVFCFGGSQGSSSLNQMFKQIVAADRSFSLIHVTGTRDYYQFQQFYDTIIKKEYIIKDFYQDIGLLYSAADVLICRAGALTLSEIVFFQIPAILVPYPGAQQHQCRNALFLAEKGAAYLCRQNESAQKECGKLLRQLLHDKAAYEKMCRQLARVRMDVSPEDFYRAILS